MGAMTFLEAALDILRRERKPLHYKELTQKAMDRKLLTFVGRTPEVTMQTQLTAAVKKAPGNPFVRVKPGVFGLLRYPEAPPEPRTEERTAAQEAELGAGAEARGRRRRRGGRGRTRRGGAEEGITTQSGRDNGASKSRPASAAYQETMAEDEKNQLGEAPEEPEIGSLSPEARAAALAESGVLESEDEDEEAAGAAAEEDELGEEGEGEGEGEEGEGEGAKGGRGALGEEDDDEGEQGEEAEAGGEGELGEEAGAGQEAEQGELEEGEETDEEDLGEEPGVHQPAAARGPEGPGTQFEEVGGRRRRRRRRRRRGGGAEIGVGELAAAAEDVGTSGFGAAPPLMAGTEPRVESSRPAAPADEAGTEGGTAAPAAAPEPAEAGPSGRRIMSPVDAAIEILRGQAPGRGMHVRQLADAAVRRRLVHGEPNEAWRVMRAALAAEPRERLRAGLRPRIRSAGSGLFALSRRPPDLDLERAEHVFGEARRALRERTLAALEQRLSELSSSAFEAIGRVLLQREGFGPATFVKRVEGTIYLEALRGRGARPSRCLIALRPGGVPGGRRAIGELRAGIRARNQDEGLLMLAGRLGEDAIAEWKQPGPPIEVADGAALAETCVRHGVGVVNATVSIDFVDADFFAELQEG
jgi:hypothetical protein